MSITPKTRKNLWGKSGFLCSYPNCKRLLEEKLDSLSGGSLTGEEAHIIATSEKGPRREFFREGMDIDNYDNLILLCPQHHKLIDDFPDKFTPDSIKNFKAEHEQWVRKCLIQAAHIDVEAEIYLEIVNKVISSLWLDRFDYWSFKLLSDGRPSMDMWLYQSFHDLGKFIVSRSFPNKYCQLEDSMTNIIRVLGDLTSMIFKFAKDCDDGEKIVVSKRVFKASNEYMNLIDLDMKFDKHVVLIHNLVLEFIRAVNFFIECIRKYIDASFRVKEGDLAVELDGFEDGTNIIIKPKYLESEKLELYRDLETFVSKMKSRDFSL